MENNTNKEVVMVGGEIVVKPIIPRRVCRNHELIWFLIGEKCPYCKRLSISGYEFEESND